MNDERDIFAVDVEEDRGLRGEDLMLDCNSEWVGD